MAIGGLNLDKRRNFASGFTLVEAAVGILLCGILVAGIASVASLMTQTRTATSSQATTAALVSSINVALSDVSSCSLTLSQLPQTVPSGSIQLAAILTGQSMTGAGTVAAIGSPLPNDRNVFVKNIYLQNVLPLGYNSVAGRPLYMAQVMVDLQTNSGPGTAATRGTKTIAAASVFLDSTSRCYRPAPPAILSCVTTSGTTPINGYGATTTLSPKAATCVRIVNSCPAGFQPSALTQTPYYSDEWYYTCQLAPSTPMDCFYDPWYSTASGGAALGQSRWFKTADPASSPRTPTSFSDAPGTVVNCWESPGDVRYEPLNCRYDPTTWNWTCQYYCRRQKCGER